ncbi:MAG: tRNA 2-thiouridine(34) synthase MnmA, partial [Flavobacteriales bacterium]|nr:tRNA 2-thiouridine(34) synthase MnmA [Flavobacteriales bacterium]
WDYQSSGGGKKETGCCSLDSINDARQMAVDRGFHHFILDIRDEFGDYIIDNFVEEYMHGRTPNPCVLCNTHIKWEALLRRADQLDCEFIATGHYAQVREENGRYLVSKGKDTNKDQSYVLWGLSQESLRRSKFPVGGFKKSEIRQMALDEGLHELVAKPESYEICFIPDNDYRGFLKRRIPGLEEKVKGGKFLDVHGKTIGEHDGYPFYTIGQRKGLGQAFGDPKYVISINPLDNTVVLGDKDDLKKQKMWVKKLNKIKYPTFKDQKEVLTKVRYKDSGTLSDITELDDDLLQVEFYGPVQGIAPGQSAVFYEGEDVLGGGFICREDDQLVQKFSSNS